MISHGSWPGGHASPLSLSLSPLMGIMAYLGGGSGGKQRGEAGDKIPRLLHHSLLMATLLGTRKTGVPNKISSLLYAFFSKIICVWLHELRYPRYQILNNVPEESDLHTSEVCKFRCVEILPPFNPLASRKTVHCAQGTGRNEILW